MPNKDVMMAQAVASMQQAMQSATRENTMVLSNIMTFRRQAVLKTLPSSFSVSDKRNLLHSSVDSPFLFVEDKVAQAEKHSDSKATKTFQEVAAAALKKRHHQVESPLRSHPANKPCTSSYRQPQRQISSFKKPSRPTSSNTTQKGRQNMAGPSKSGFRK